VRSFDEELQELERGSRRRWLRAIPGPQGVTMAVDGQPMVNFSSNDYLGLAAHPRVRGAFIKAVEKLGAGAGASRLVCGTRSAHAELDSTLAAFKGTEAALSFGSGYAAALGTLGAVLRPGDVALLDRLAHACLVDGARASGALVRRFRHHDVGQLAGYLEWAFARVRPGGRVVVATEAIFSMDGDRAPLVEMSELTRARGALLLVDEAHSIGICGRDGRGLVDELGVGDRVDLHLGTLSKAVGLAGGYVAGSRSAIDLIINRARSLIYSTAPPPALAATAVYVIREIFASALGAALREAMWRNAAHLHARLSPGASPAPVASPIFPVHCGEEAAALRAAEALRDAGIFAPAIRPPTVPPGQSRVRLSVSAAHTPAQIDLVADAIGSLRAQMAPAASSPPVPSPTVPSPTVPSQPVPPPTAPAP